MVLKALIRIAAGFLTVKCDFFDYKDAEDIQVDCWGKRRTVGELCVWSDNIGCWHKMDSAKFRWWVRSSRSRRLPSQTSAVKNPTIRLARSHDATIFRSCSTKNLKCALFFPKPSFHGTSPTLCTSGSNWMVRQYSHHTLLLFLPSSSSKSDCILTLSIDSSNYFRVHSWLRHSNLLSQLLHHTEILVYLF